MANMSYCRFRNTKIDLEDCLDALYEYELSKEEHDAMKKMFTSFINYLMDEDIVRDEDGELDERLKDFFDSVNIKN